MLTFEKMVKKLKNSGVEIKAIIPADTRFMWHIDFAVAGQEMAVECAADEDTGDVNLRSFALEMQGAIDNFSPDDCAVRLYLAAKENGEPIALNEAEKAAWKIKRKTSKAALELVVFTDGMAAA